MTDTDQNTDDLIKLVRALRMVDLPTCTARRILEEYDIRIVHKQMLHDKNPNTLYVSKKEAEFIFERHRSEHLYADDIPDWGFTRKEAAKYLQVTPHTVASYCRQGVLNSYEVFTPKGKLHYVSKAECKELHDIKTPNLT